jgi:hypothetical protein
MICSQFLFAISASAINIMSLPGQSTSPRIEATVTSNSPVYSMVSIAGSPGGTPFNNRPSFYSYEEVLKDESLRFAPPRSSATAQPVSSLAQSANSSPLSSTNSSTLSRSSVNSSSNSSQLSSNTSSSNSSAQSSSRSSNSNSSSSSVSNSSSSSSSVSSSSSSSSSSLQSLVPSSDFHLNAILSRIAPSGGIKSYQTENANKINPYFQNLAVCGIASEISFGSYPNKQALAEAGWKALEWYKNKQDPNTGIVYDHSVNGSVETSLNYADSLDSYVGTYYVALQCMYKATGDLARLKTFEQSMIKAYKALDLVYDPVDKLYIARTGWQVKYTMDLVELERGLQEGAALFSSIGNSEYSSKFSQNYNELATAIESRFWNAKNNDYYWAIAGLPPQEVIYTSDWSVCYADAKANIWPTLWRTNENPNRAATLTSKFDTVSKNTLDTKSTPCKWNPFVQIAMLKAGRIEIAQSYYSYGSTLAQQNRLGGFYTTGHDGLFLITKYKLAGKTLVL